MLVEIFLKLLVCIVDVELLEAVHLCEGTRETRKSVISFMKNSNRSEQVSNYMCAILALSTSKFSKPKMSRMLMDLKSSLPLMRLLSVQMIQLKHWE